MLREFQDEIMRLKAALAVRQHSRSSQSQWASRHLW